MSFKKLRLEILLFSTKLTSLLHQESTASIILISVMDNFQVDTLRLYRRDFLQILKFVIWIFLYFMEVMSCHLRKVSFLILVPVMITFTMEFILFRNMCNQKN